MTATVIANTEIGPGVHLIEMHAPLLAQAAQPGQYCMVRCCDPLATDPLIRRPFFVQSVRRGQAGQAGLCSLLVQVRGRGSSWLAGQLPGAVVDILGPMGQGWTIRRSSLNLLLVSEEGLIDGLTLLAQVAVEQELAVTLIAQSDHAASVYPPALLPPEVEYVIVTSDGSTGQQGNVVDALADYLNWADAVYCNVSRETSQALYRRYERLRTRNFAQAMLLYPLVCGNGVCQTCPVETFSGQKLVCRDGPVFDLREMAR